MIEIKIPFLIRTMDSIETRRILDEEDFWINARKVAQYVSDDIYDLGRFKCEQVSYRINKSLFEENSEVIPIINSDMLKTYILNYSEFRKSCSYSVDVCNFTCGDFEFTLPKVVKVKCMDDHDTAVIRTLKYGRNYFYKDV